MLPHGTNDTVAEPQGPHRRGSGCSADTRLSLRLLCLLLQLQRA
jgi:hypothetical protein